MKAKTLIRNSRARAQLKTFIGKEGNDFLQDSLQAFTRLLPHTQTTLWVVKKSSASVAPRWWDNNRRSIFLGVTVHGENAGSGQCFTLTSRLTRKTAQAGVGRIQRTLDLREFNLCVQIAKRIGVVLHGQSDRHGAESLRAVGSVFDEQVVAAHLQHRHDIGLDMGLVFTGLRHLAEQSYENKSLTFGLLICRDGANKSPIAVFPFDFFEKKRYRALSDGFRTAFRVTSSGKLLGLRDLRQMGVKGNQTHFYPEWCEYIAEASSAGTCGICLTRQGDILVFDSGNLRFTYRVGRWQYWNHRHVCDLFRNRARVQHVPRSVLPKVVKNIYRTALDVSFRRSGALFVLLRNRANKRKLVIEGDAIGDGNRESLHQAFDESLGRATVNQLSRVLLTELAGLDGGVVLDNKGRLLAYGAVLKTSGHFSPSEGSRTKAAISASRYGIAVKVSSDGDITFYESRKAFLEL